ncbi:MAG TPA: DUF692 domain-containing protein [Candidatus Obscuribacterales bacterium]
MKSEFVKYKAMLPILGVGLGYRPEIAEETLEHPERIDFLEIVSENYLNTGSLRLKELDRAGDFQIIPHGISLSIGSTDPIDIDYLNDLRSLFLRIGAPWWSDHLCFTGIGGMHLHELCPLPYTNEAVRHVAERIWKIQEYMGLPFLLENITSYMTLPGAEMDEARFTAEVLERADCGMLLDVNNVFVNAHNHNYDPYAFVDALPLERVVQIHIAGHRRSEALWIDTHGSKICDGVYDLLAYVLRKTKVHAILLERDQYFPKFSAILDQLHRIKLIASKEQPELVAHARAMDARTGAVDARTGPVDAQAGAVDAQARAA